MSVTDQLKEEHKVIERMLDVLRVASDRLERGEEVSMDVFREAVDFIRNFADRCHHGKEEETLFPVLEERGIPREGGPIGVMLTEHEQGRGFVGALTEAVERYARGDEAAKAVIIENARGYVNLLRQHIPKEDTVLFPMVDRLLGDEDQRRLLERFEEVEEERIGKGKHQHYIDLVYEELDWEGTQKWERKVVPDVVLHDIPRMVREFEENRRIMVREIRVPDGWKARTELEIRRVMRNAT